MAFTFVPSRDAGTNHGLWSPRRQAVAVVLPYEQSISSSPESANSVVRGSSRRGSVFGPLRCWMGSSLLVGGVILSTGWVTGVQVLGEYCGWRPPLSDPVASDPGWASLQEFVPGTLRDGKGSSDRVDWISRAGGL
ncbi:hypothetical protein FKM82_020943 [Ascaphus truei]